jgi:hypothetical protein
MNAIIYPAYLHQDFERRWATRMAGVKPRRARNEDTDTCACGNVVAASRGLGYLRTGVIGRWRCAACGRRSEMDAELKVASGRRLECRR